MHAIMKSTNSLATASYPTILHRTKSLDGLHLRFVHELAIARLIVQKTCLDAQSGPKVL